MTDWAKLAGQTPKQSGTLSDFVKTMLKDVQVPVGSVRLEGLLEQMEGRFIGPEKIKAALGVKDLGRIEPYPAGLLEALTSDSLITPGKKVHQDHRLIYLPESFDGQPNTILAFNELVQRNLKEGDNPVFEEGNDWYHAESWVQSPAPKGSWLLTPDTVPDDTREINFNAQSGAILSKYQPYVRGEAAELIGLLALTERVTGERLYPNGTWGWTNTETDKAGAFPRHLVLVGCFSSFGFEVGPVPPVSTHVKLGAFLRWNFGD